jgi:hypothetical protein
MQTTAHGQMIRPRRIGSLFALPKLPSLAQGKRAEEIAAIRFTM